MDHVGFAHNIFGYDILVDNLAAGEALRIACDELVFTNIYTRDGHKLPNNGLYDATCVQPSSMDFSVGNVSWEDAGLLFGKFLNTYIFDCNKF